MYRFPCANNSEIIAVTKIIGICFYHLIIVYWNPYDEYCHVLLPNIRKQDLRCPPFCNLYINRLNWVDFFTALVSKNLYIKDEKRQKINILCNTSLRFLTCKSCWTLLSDLHECRNYYIDTSEIYFQIASISVLCWTVIRLMSMFPYEKNPVLAPCRDFYVLNTTIIVTFSIVTTSTFVNIVCSFSPATHIWRHYLRYAFHMYVLDLIHTKYLLMAHSKILHFEWHWTALILISYYNGRIVDYHYFWQRYIGYHI